MSKGLRILIALLCAVSFGICGFAVYKVVNTAGTARSSAPTPALEAAPMSDEATIVSADSAQPAGNTGPVSQSGGQGVSWELGEPYSYYSLNEISSLYTLQYSLPVTNTGSVDLYMPLATVDLIGADGQVKLSTTSVIPSVQVLRPGETNYYFLTAPGVARDDTVTLHFEPRSSGYPCVRLPVHDLSIDLENVRVSGQVENNTDREFRTTVFAVVVFFDEQDHAIEVLHGLTGLLAPGETKEFRSGYGSLDSRLRKEPYSRYEVFAYPDSAALVQP